MKESQNVKIQVFVPKQAVDKVRAAIGQTGANKIGNYSHCTFETAGKGYFLPLEGANPTIGQVGKIEQVDEVKIEFICPKDKISEVMESIKSVHPYEEVAFDIFPLLDI